MSSIFKGIIANEAKDWDGADYDRWLDKDDPANSPSRRKAEKDPEDLADPASYHDEEPTYSLKNLAKADYSKDEGTAPNGKRYNMSVTYNGEPHKVSQAIRNFKDQEWGAKAVVDVVQDSPNQATLYAVDNHKYGMWKPWKDQDSTSQPLKISNENAQNEDHMDPASAYQQAREITRQIKYDQTVSDILVQIHMLAEKSGIPEQALEYAVNEVHSASAALESAIYGLDEVFKEAVNNGLDEDSDMRYAAEKTPAINPYGGDRDRQFRGAISEFSSNKNISEAEARAVIEREYANTNIALDQLDYERINPNDAVVNETPDTSGPIGVQPGGWKTYRPKPAGEIEEDTSYATGGGQGGNAGESYRKFTPKVAGTIEENLEEDLHKWFKEKWVRFGPDGKIKGPCARGSDNEGKPKCLPQKKAHSLGKKGRKYAASKKRREDPNPERSGKAINVDTKKKSNENEVLDEKWTKKYKDSINCSHPKGFSQKAHCAGKKKHNESVEMEMTCPNCGMCETHSEHKNLDEACWKGYHKEGNKKMFGKTYPNCVKNEGVAEESCPHCGGEMVSEELMNEKKDACYYKVKSRYKVWPSAYASGALVKCRKKGASNWGTGGKKNESSIMKGMTREAANPAQQAAIAIAKKKKQGVAENAENLHIGDPVIITGKGIEFEGTTGEIVSFGQQNRFVVVNLYNHGKHSFHSSDVSYNEYAGSDEEEARAYDSDTDARNWNMDEQGVAKESSIMKGIVRENPTHHYVLYVNGKPAVKAEKSTDLKPCIEFLKSKHPDAKVELKYEAIGSSKDVTEAEETQSHHYVLYINGKPIMKAERGSADLKDYIDRLRHKHPDVKVELKYEPTNLPKNVEETSSTGMGGGSAGIGGGSMVGGPTTYEQEYDPFKSRGPQRIRAMTYESTLDEQSKKGRK
jgi:hypothetical protein